MISGIYQIRNLINGKIYIGSAFDFDKRWNVHLSQLNKISKIKHHSKHLQNAWDKYGESNFIFEIIETVPRFDNETKLEFKTRLVNNREQHYLDTLMSWDRNIGYNINKKADSRLGSILSEKTKEKIRLSNEGKKHSLETKAKMKKNHPRLSGKNHMGYGKKHSEDAKIKMKQNHPRLSGKNHPRFNIPLTVNHKNKLSKLFSGKNNPMYGISSKDVIIKKYGIDKWNEMNKQRSINGKNKGTKAVIQLDKKGNIIKEYISLTEANLTTGINLGLISRVCNTKYSAGGFIWKWKDINTDKNKLNLK